jgi:hypothetical protein
MSKMLFVNLPVKDIAAATRLYEAIGCTKNDTFSDPQTSSMIWSDTITFHLMTREKFATFTSKPIAQAHAACGALFALSRDSRADVDTIVAAAQAAGGKADVREPMDLGWLYNRAFEDVDGNVFEALWMDASAVGG